MSTRTLTILLAGVALLLSASYAARTYLAKRQCDERGLIYESGRGCIEPQRAPPVILERGLTRT